MHKPSDGKKPNPLKVAGGIIFLVIVFTFVAALVSGKAGIAEVSDREVAVIVNYMTGSMEVDDVPGIKIFIPFAMEVFTFDKSQNEFVMEGDTDKDSNHVRKLTVRARDGSNLYMDKIEIQYALLPNEANFVINDSGPGEMFKQQWIKAYARSILRDEFGYKTTEELADQASYPDIVEKVKEELNNQLNPHGILVTQITTPKPRFGSEYEQAIEDRQLSIAEVGKLEREREQLIKERERRIATIDADKKIALEGLIAQLEAERLDAEKEQIKRMKSADAYKITRIAEGTAQRDEKVALARGLVEKYTKEAQGLEAKAKALALQGEVLVREIIAQKLKDITFEIIPYSLDSLPQKVQLDDDKTRR